MVRGVDRQGEVLIWCMKMLGTRETENGTQIEELLPARASGHQRAWQDVETYPDPRRRQGPCQRGKKLEAWEDKEVDY